MSKYKRRVWNQAATYCPTPSFLIWIRDLHQWLTDLDPAPNQDHAHFFRGSQDANKNYLFLLNTIRGKLLTVFKIKKIIKNSQNTTNHGFLTS
jgi:hypothetical protein